MSLAKGRRPVKRRAYSSPLRDDQARLTKRAIVDAAAKLFGERGYAAVSVDAIAAESGVSRATVFTSVGGKPALLRAAYRAAFGRAAGEIDREMPLVERPRSLKLRAEKTLNAYLAGYTALATELDRHLARVHVALREAAAADADAYALLEEIEAERRRGAATIVNDVRTRAKLRDGIDIDHAADAVWALIDPTWFYMLVHQRGWTEARFTEWLVRMLRAELVGPANRKEMP
jgi:AcrR family transcriptional regulator